MNRTSAFIQSEPTWTGQKSAVSSAALQPRPDGTARLLVRERYAYRQWRARCLVEAVGVASFIMSRRMLHDIKNRSEATLLSVP